MTSRIALLLLVSLSSCTSRMSVTADSDADGFDTDPPPATPNTPTPNTNTPLLSADVWVSAGDRYTCAIKERKLYCWGANAHGQIGDGSTRAMPLPTPIAPDRQWSMVDTSFVFEQHTCAVTTGGALYCWGANRHGQIGDGSQDSRPTPTRISDAAWQSVSSGSEHTCGIRADRTLWCWGANRGGELGLDLGSYGPDEVTAPSKVGDKSDWTAVTAAYAHSCGTRADGTLWCWGESRGGELGIPVDYLVGSPKQVGSETSWATVIGAHLHSCALRTDGALYCWGQNYTGQIGDGATAKLRNEPVRIGEDTWSFVSAGGGAKATGGGHTCAVRADGALFCWGANLDGQLGLGEGAETQVNVPTRVGSDADWIGVTAGHDHTCAVKADRSLYCWGSNASGQLGDGTTQRRDAPTRIDL